MDSWKRPNADTENGDADARNNADSDSDADGYLRWKMRTKKRLSRRKGS